MVRLAAQDLRVVLRLLLARAVLAALAFLGQVLLPLLILLSRLLHLFLSIDARR